MLISKSEYMLYLKHPAWLWIKKHEKRLLPPIDEALQADPKAVIVASPAPTHLEYASVFLKKNIPTLIEKPISVHKDDILEYDINSDNSLELAEKSKKLNELSKEIEELKELSREKLMFNEISKEANLIYPDLKQFEIFEKIRTDFNSTKKLLVVSVIWDSLLLNSEIEKLNLSIRRWLEFQLDSKDFIVENN